MSNLTISTTEDTLRWARVEAAKRNVSVSRLVGEMLTEKMQRDNAYDTAMQEALKFRPIAFESAFLTRDAIYAERLERFR
jgi:hypothetical protein